MTATVTDNGSNFVKAFQVYQNHATGSNSEADEEEGNDDEVTFADPHVMLFTGDEDDSNTFLLPPHHRCVSHTLNLISTTDVER